jgi:hypothetical protein
MSYWPARLGIDSWPPLKGLQIRALLTSWYPEDGKDGLVHSAHLVVLIAVLSHARSGGGSDKKETMNIYTINRSAVVIEIDYKERLWMMMYI